MNAVPAPTKVLMVVSWGWKYLGWHPATWHPRGESKVNTFWLPDTRPLLNMTWKVRVVESPMVEVTVTAGMR